MGTDKGNTFARCNDEQPDGDPQRRRLLLSLVGLARATPAGAAAGIALTACGGGGGGDPPTGNRAGNAPSTDGGCNNGATAKCAAHAPGSGGGMMPPATGGGSPGPGSGGGSAPPVTGGSRRFAFLGPNSASVSASMGMMGSLAIPTLAGDVRVWTINGGSGGFNGDRRVPGPLIELTQGAPAAITLSNMSMLPHTIHPHGLDVDTLNDGVPQTSFAVDPMGSNTYRFVAPFAGTYLYHCHVDAALHVEMGMYGAVIVRPPSGATNVAWDGGPAFDLEYVWQLSTMDTRWHSARNTGDGTLRYRPDVFLLNGLDGAAPATDVATAITAPQGSRVLLRLINYGYMPAVVDLGGAVFDVIASDGRPAAAPVIGQTRWRILAGERYDLLVAVPAAGSRQATVRYENIRGTGTVGSVQTVINAI